MSDGTATGWSPSTGMATTAHRLAPAGYTHQTNCIPRSQTEDRLNRQHDVRLLGDVYLGIGVGDVDAVDGKPHLNLVCSSASRLLQLCREDDPIHTRCIDPNRSRRERPRWNNVGSADGRC